VSPSRGRKAVLAALLVGSLAPACSGKAAGDVLTVFAAASLTDAFGESAAAFEAEHPGVTVTLNFAASSALREQILAGAPADVFASASADDMDQLAGAGAPAGEPRVFARNRLVIAVPAGNPAGITGLEDFADPGRLIGLCAEEVPCGRYARRALASAGVTASLDTNEPDVRALVTKVAAGELDAGIVYATDVTDGVEAIEIPVVHAVAAAYSIVVLGASPRQDLAGAFVDFVLSPRGQARLAVHGFEAP
jgi:molybdate transport system substrate-binding protein